MLKVTSEWTGFLGGPGYTNFYFDGVLEGGTVPQQIADKSRTFWDAIKTLLPQSVNIRVNPAVTQIDPATGLLLNELTVATPPLAVQGTSVGKYSAVSGAAMNWQTNGIVEGKRVRGRTFIVPMGGATYQDNGTLDPATQTTLNAAAAGLIAPPLSPATDFGVWHRAVAKAGGSWHKAVGSRLADKTAFMKSRRD